MSKFISIEVKLRKSHLITYFLELEHSLQAILTHSMTLDASKQKRVTKVTAHWNIMSRLKVETPGSQQSTQLSRLLITVEIILSVQQTHARSVSKFHTQLSKQTCHTTQSSASSSKHRHTLLCTYAQQPSGDILLGCHHLASDLGSRSRIVRTVVTLIISRPLINPSLICQLAKSIPHIINWISMHTARLAMLI